MGGWSQFFPEHSLARPAWARVRPGLRGDDQSRWVFPGPGCFTLDDTQSTLNALAGDRLPAHPDLTLHGYALYDFPVSAGWNGFVRGEVSYTGEIVANFVGDPNIPRPSTGEYTLAHVRGGVANGRWEVAAYVNNLFDTEGHSYRFVDWTDREETFVLRPRTIGVSFRTRM